MSRLRSDFWVSAYLRRCNAEGIVAMLRRRGAAEAGAILIKLDHLDGTATLYGPAPQTVFEERAVERLFAPMHKEAVIDIPTAEERLGRQISFDPDLWIIETEDRQGRHFLDLAEG